MLKVDSCHSTIQPIQRQKKFSDGHARKKRLQHCRFIKNGWRPGRDFVKKPNFTRENLKLSLSAVNFVLLKKEDLF